MLLTTHLTGVTDQRMARGKVHPLVGVLGLTVVVLMAGGPGVLVRSHMAGAVSLRG